MEKKVKVYKNRSWAWGTGVFLLLIAALVLSNQFGGFIELGIWSIIVSALAVMFMVQSIIEMNFGVLPIPIAALYFILQTPLSDMFNINLPQISFWPLVLVTVLATAGLSVLIPSRKFKKHKTAFVHTFGENVGGVHRVDDGQIEEGGEDNNPRISVQFGSVSRYLHADCLETATLDCSFGALEVYFDHVQLNPNGAEAFLNCRLGAIEMYVPANWCIIDNMNASLGGVDVKGRHRMPDENAPRLTLTGNVSLGGVEVHRI